MNAQLVQMYARRLGVWWVVNACALGGEAWGGEEPASSVMEREMRQSGAVSRLSDWLCYPSPFGPA